MPVAIAGMHRSGTSLVARLLNLCGLDLGPPEKLTKPSPENPDGFWEYLEFVAVNDELLSRYGGTWNMPPFFPPDWEAHPAHDDLRAGANLSRALPRAVGLEGSAQFPNVAVLAPGVARSDGGHLRAEPAGGGPVAAARNGLSYLTGMRVWLAYNRQLLDAATQHRVVTHYENYFADPEAELARVRRALGLPADAELIRTACAAIKTELRHGRYTTADLTGVDAPAEVVACYSALLRRSGGAARRRWRRAGHAVAVARSAALDAHGGAAVGGFAPANAERKLAPPGQRGPLRCRTGQVPGRTRRRPPRWPRPATN